MATKFIILNQIHRPKTLLSTPKSLGSKRNKSKPTTSENMLNTIFPGKTLTEIYHKNINSHPINNPLLFMEDQSVKEDVTSKEQQGKVSNFNYKEGKSMNKTKYGEMRCEVARLSLLWYMKCSISYILRKARAYYDEFCCDSYVESNNTMVVADPYFAIPVLPYNNYN